MTVAFIDQVAGFFLDAPVGFELNPVEEEIAHLQGILSDLGCVNSFNSPLSQPLAVLLSDAQDGISGVPLFRINNVSRTQWVRRIADNTRLLAYSVASYQGDKLQWNTDLCCLCLGRRLSLIHI